jgi:hypothetical protein
MVLIGHLTVVGASGTEFAARAARMDAASVVEAMIFVGILVWFCVFGFSGGQGLRSLFDGLGD